MQRVAVVGAGLMGHGIAQVFAVAGRTVVVTDPDEHALATLHERVRANLEGAGLDPATADRIETRRDLEAGVAGAELVVEAAPENVVVKRELFARLDGAVAPDTILATNTSVISIGDIASAVGDPGRVVGTHFWNPPHLIPLVEVTQAETTRPETVERTMAVLAAAGKTPIHVKRDVPGFVGNRLQHALWREAIAIVADGICDAADVDRVVKTSFGLRLAALGPLENADLVGLDLTLAIHDYLLPHIDASPDPSPLLATLVQEGHLGMKTGQGFYEWDDESAAATRRRVFEHLVAVTAA